MHTHFTPSRAPDLTAFIRAVSWFALGALSEDYKSDGLKNRHYEPKLLRVRAIIHAGISASMKASAQMRKLSRNPWV